MFNKEDFEHVFSLYYHPICKYLRLFTDDYEMIEDVVQSVYVKLWEDKEKISLNHIKAYLFVSAKSRMLNSVRDQQRRRDILHNYFINELEREQAEDIVNIDEFTSLVEKSINQLPPKAKKIFNLNRYSDMSYKDIAQQENISVRTVENHISKALQRIGEHLISHYKKLSIILIMF